MCIRDRFWVVAIAISLAIGLAYPHVYNPFGPHHDYLRNGLGYGTSDVLGIWLLGFLTPAVMYVLARAGQAVLLRDQINVRDGPIQLLRKVAKTWPSPARPAAVTATQHGFLAQDRVAGGGLWISPLIRVRWLPTATPDLM